MIRSKIKLNRHFKGVWIPKEIWLAIDLTIMEKVFLVEIDSLDGEEGCFASNNYFANFFGLTPGRCSQIIKSLEQKKYIKISYETKEKQVIKRTIKVFNKLKGVFNILKGGYLENDEDNNILFINNNKNTKKKLNPYEIFIKSCPDKFKDKEIEQSIKEWFQYKKESGKPIKTKTTITKLINKLNPYPKEIIIACIDASINAPWAGLFPESVQPSKNQKINKENNQQHNPNDVNWDAVMEKRNNKKYVEPED